MMLAYAAWLCVVSKLAFGQWFPPLGDDNKGFWFYAALLSLLLGRSLVTPFYTSPANAFSYAIPALAALFIVNGWESWAVGEQVVFAIAVGFSGLVAVIASGSMLLKDSVSGKGQRLSMCLKVISDYLGNPRVIFSFVMLFALYAFHRESPVEMLWIGGAWATTVALDPLEAGWKLFHRLKVILMPGISSEIIGEIAAYQSPGIVLIRQHGHKNITLGTPLLIKDPHAPGKVGMALDYTGRDEGMLLRAIELDGLETAGDTHQLNKSIPEGSAAVIGDCSEDSILNRSDEIVGIVAPETSIERLYFEVVQENELEEGRLVEALIGEKLVLYQVVNGLTKEEVIQQKNTYGYARAQAQKIGIWNEQHSHFDLVKWMPKLNAPVFLREEEGVNAAIEAIGYLPRTDFSVSIKSLPELVSHNTAILGILGIGKSYLAFELVERMLAEEIKVICLDLTDEYSDQLKEHCYDFSGDDLYKDLIEITGAKGKTSVSQNVEEGGSKPVFAGVLDSYIERFIHSDMGKNLIVFNPSQYEVWRQDSKPFSGKASMASLSPTEITQLFTESALKACQKLGKVEKGHARVCLVYEEAHSLVPEWNTVVNEGDKAAVNGTARAVLQGRKFGLGCLLITQRTANVTKTILNQCNSIFAMRIFDDTGKEFLSNYIGRDYASILPSLQERYAVFFGKASSCENPVLIRLNDRDKFLKVFRKKHPLPELPKTEAVEPEATGGEEMPDEDIPF